MVPENLPPGTKVILTDPILNDNIHHTEAELIIKDSYENGYIMTTTLSGCSEQWWYQELSLPTIPLLYSFKL